MVEVLHNKDCLVDKITNLLNEKKSFCLEPKLWDLTKDLKNDLASFESHAWIASSGTYQKKLIALSNSALRSSARAVNSWLKADQNDCWALSLPLNHIGGLAILVRSIEGRFKVAHFQERWEPYKFCNFIAREKCTLASLVPTQLFDLVSRELVAPPSLRAVIIGGAHLSQVVYTKSRELGWPVLPSYGLTECCSQVATASLDSLDKMQDKVPIFILPHIQCETDSERTLLIKGSSLLSAYISMPEKSLNQLVAIDPSQYFRTNDLASLIQTESKNELHIIGRRDRQIKIRGWLVALDEIEDRIRSFFDSKALQPMFAVATKSDLRDGYKLILHISSGILAATLPEELNQYLKMLDIHSPNISEIIEHTQFPLLQNGKIDNNALGDWSRST